MNTTFKALIHNGEFVELEKGGLVVKKIPKLFYPDMTIERLIEIYRNVYQFLHTASLINTDDKLVKEIKLLQSCTFIDVELHIL